MKPSEAQRLVILADAHAELPKLIDAFRAKRKSGYDRVAMLIGIHQIDEGVGSEEIESIEVDLITAKIILRHVAEIISVELDGLGYEKE